MTMIARGALDALRDRGIRVPEEVAVMGFDNWDVMVTGARPPLTSVDMNLRALGREAGEHADRDDRRPAGIRRQAAASCTLVVRQSCGARAVQNPEDQ